MYLNDSEINKIELKQGDVLDGVQILGTLNLDSIVIHTTQGGQQVGWQVSAQPKIGFVAVLSHSCELSLENGLKVTSIILAPIRDINTASEKGKIQSLIQTNEIGHDTVGSFLKYYYLKPNVSLPYSEGAVVDFSKCFSVKKEAYKTLLGKKKIQLTPQSVQSFGRKLALYYHRNGTSTQAV